MNKFRKMKMGSITQDFGGTGHGDRELVCAKVVWDEQDSSPQLPGEGGGPTGLKNFEGGGHPHTPHHKHE